MTSGLERPKSRGFHPEDLSVLADADSAILAKEEGEDVYILTERPSGHRLFQVFDVDKSDGGNSGGNV